MTKIKFVAPVCLSVLLLAGCTTSYKTVDLDKDTKGYHIVCGGQPYASDDDCLDRAKYICGDNGYVVLNHNDPTYPHSQSLWDLTTHDILVRCNKAPPALKSSPAVNAPATESP